MIQNYLKRLNDVVTGTEYYKLLGDTGRYVLCGPCALNRVGLSSLLSSTIQAWTDIPSISGIDTKISQFFFNPCILFTDTVASKKSEGILIPTRERALAEYIWLREYFDEGILIEGLKNYIWLSENNLEELYRVAPKYRCTKDMLDYWIKEAREDYED